MSAMGPLNIKSVRCVANPAAILGEGPLWDPRINRLLFVDIKGERLFSYDPGANSLESHEIPGMLSAIGLAKDGGYIGARRDGFVHLTLDESGPFLTPIVDPETNMPGNRFNDGKVDPAGGFWAGTMDNSEEAIAGSWWRLSPENGVTRLDTDFHVTNGPAFDHDRGRVYFTDSAARTIFTAETDGSDMRNKRIFLKFSGNEGYPDGMCVDREGGLWVAFWDGGAIRRFAPDGEKLQTVPVDAPRPTSIALVDDRIYVTSARVGLDENALQAAPESGGLIEVLLDRPLDPQSAFYFG